MVSLGVDSQYRIERMRKLILRPEFTGEAYRWTMKDSGGADSTVSTEREFIFVAEKPGTYALRLDIIDAQNPVMQEVEINVDEESVAYSRYITEVYEYRPAPGQFVNIMPLYEEGDTEEDMCRKARESISGTNDIMISLGGYGGYVTFGFDHTVVNVPGQKDFKILGNAFYADANPNPSAPDSGGSCEPGIVMVSIDQNNNGLPDDEWYELKGSEFGKEETLRDYAVTYYRPTYSGASVQWRDNRGVSGKIDYLKAYHDQPSYYPNWIDAESYVLYGTCLESRTYDQSGNGSYWVNDSYDWGYADNFGEDRLSDDENAGAGAVKTYFKIENAVDGNGEPANLAYIDFVKVQTGVNAKAGWLGENSTEVFGFTDENLNQGK